jgi:signal peptidase I
VFRNPWDPTQNVIKRVVARGGDKVAIRAGVVVVNGRELDEPYLVHPSDRDGSMNETERTLEPGQVYVLGDNRAASFDSRRFGPIEPSCVVGRAVLALWPLRRL